MILSGCGSQAYTAPNVLPSDAQVMKVRVGMAKIQVIEALGSPIGQNIYQGNTVYEYSGIISPDFPFTRGGTKGYMVEFDQNEKVKNIICHETGKPSRILLP